MKVLVIGGGNMGYTYAKGMSKSSLVDGEILIYDASEVQSIKLKKKKLFKVCNNLEKAVSEVDVIFLVVKPFHAADLFETMKSAVNNNQIVVSLMAGVSIEAIRKGLGIDKVVRAMPNLPAKVGLGMTSYTESKAVSRIEILTISKLLDTTGEAIYVENENFIDKSTGISGSGPAYVFYFMESMMQAALEMGFSQNDSKVLVTQTFEGAVKLFKESDLSPTGWMDRVASKGGTTRAALDSMKENKVNELIKEAAFSAFERAVELSEEFE